MADKAECCFCSPQTFPQDGADLFQIFPVDGAEYCFIPRFLDRWCWFIPNVPARWRWFIPNVPDRWCWFISNFPAAWIWFIRNVPATAARWRWFILNFHGRWSWRPQAPRLQVQHWSPSRTSCSRSLQTSVLWSEKRRNYFNRISTTKHEGLTKKLMIPKKLRSGHR